jgi:hypothetical protein
MFTFLRNGTGERMMLLDKTRIPHEIERWVVCNQLWGWRGVIKPRGWFDRANCDNYNALLPDELKLRPATVWDPSSTPAQLPGPRSRFSVDVKEDIWPNEK